MTRIFPPQGIKLALGAEVAVDLPDHTTYVNDTAIGANNQYYRYMQAPPTFPFYTVSKIEVKNGSVVNGNFIVGIYNVKESPPTTQAELLLAYTRQKVQAGTNAIQSIPVTDISHIGVIPASSLLGVHVWTASTTAQFKTKTIGSINNQKSVTFSTVPPLQNSSAWVAGTEEIYLKLLLKPLVVV